MLWTYLLHCTALILIGIVIGLTPKWMRKNVHFGVTLPFEAANKTQVKGWYKRYFLLSIGASFLGVVALTIAMRIANDTTTSIHTTTLFFLLLLGLLQLVLYAVFHQKAKQFKADHYAHDRYQKKERITIETTFRNENKPSFRWGFLIGFALILLTTLIPIFHFDDIPNYVAPHWSLGQTAAYRPKSIGFFLWIPFVQLFFLLILSFVNRIVAQTKQLINPRKPQASLKNNHTYRQGVCRFLTLIAVATNTLLLLMQLSTVFEIASVPILTRLTSIYVALIFTSLLFFMFKYGQGGSRLKETGTDENDFEMYDDDAHWKWGMIYYNPSDPILFVEKKIGVGVTVNFGNKTAWLIVAGVATFTIFILFLSLWHA